MYPNIRALREESGLSQKQVSALLGCSQQAYSSYEHGKRDVPPEVLIQLAEIHHTTVEYLLGRTRFREIPLGFRQTACLE